MATTLADQAKHNGGGDGDAAVRDRRRGALPSPVGALVGDALGAVKKRASKRLTADLHDRDPDYLREMLPLLWLISTFYFRGEVRNLGNIPEDGPALLVGNHSGGNVIPDSFIFTLAFSTYFGVERRYFQLAHNLAIAWPVIGDLLRRSGTISASPENAEKALESGAPVLVYPGGDWETHRPSWEGDKVDFAGRKGFIRLALEAGVPIVPVVSVGGQETALFLSRGAGLAKALRLDKLFRLKVLPISIAAPWGLNVGDFLGHIPLPAKITIEVLPPIDVREEFGPDPDLDEVYDHVTGQMQDALDALAAERRFPVIG
ncbi:MAG TPA: lysophospholipid acyltransferase family protein [Solirubrobacterales bacterium]